MFRLFKQEDKRLETRIYFCACCSFEHQLIFNHTHDEYDNDLTLYVHLDHRPFFTRVKQAIKHIFGYKSRFGTYDEFIFTKENLVDLKEFINKIDLEKYNM